MDGSDGFGHFGPLRVLDDENTSRRKEFTGSKPFQARHVQVFPVVRRIDEGNIKLDRYHVEGPREVQLQNFKPFLDVEGFKVLANDPDRLSRLVDEIDLRGPTADRFDSHGTHSRAAIEECRAPYCRSENIENCLPQFVARRPDAGWRGTFQPPAFKLSCDYSHDHLPRLTRINWRNSRPTPLSQIVFAPREQ